MMNSIGFNDMVLLIDESIKFAHELTHNDILLSDSGSPLTVCNISTLHTPIIAIQQSTGDMYSIGIDSAICTMSEHYTPSILHVNDFINMSNDSKNVTYGYRRYGNTILRSILYIDSSNVLSKPTIAVFFNECDTNYPKFKLYDHTVVVGNAIV